MRKIIFLILLFLLLSQNSIFAAGKPPSPSPISNSVCIDAGHGGSDIGTNNQDLTEKEVNLQVAQLLEGKLKAAGYTVFMTRTNDSTLSNADRYNYCNTQKAAILISIHHNGSNNNTTDYS